MLYVVGDMRGVTCLDNIMYVVCDKSSTIRLYNMDTCSPLDIVINIKGMILPRDITVCHDDRQLYVADYNYCIWRVSADDHSYVKWLTTESAADTFRIYKLSLTTKGRLLVTLQPRTLHQYSTTDRQLLRVIELPGFVKGLYHAVEMERQTFVVSHKGTTQNEEQHAVSDLFIVFVTIVTA